MLHFVYILYSASRDLFYVGITVHLEQRISEHNSGKSGFTFSGILWRLLWYTIKSSENEAETLERKLKNYSREKKICFIEKNEKGRVDGNLLYQISKRTK